METLIESLAELGHKRWVRWMDYMLDCAMLVGDEDAPIKTIYLNGEVFNYWVMKSELMYEDLSEDEKDIYREQAYSYIKLLNKIKEE